MVKKLILFLAAALLLGSCCTCKHITSATNTEIQEQNNDSVRIEYRERIVTVPDTVFVEIPAQTAERTTADSVSHLENDYAVSDARLNTDGTLTHTLNSKPQLKPVPTEKRIEYRDSIVYRDRILTKTVTKTETKTEYVEHKRSWWEQTQIYGFWAAIILFAITYRKKIFQAVVRLFTRK